MRWENIDFESRTIKITQKGGRTNNLPMEDILYTELQKLFEKTGASEWVFQSKLRPKNHVKDIRIALNKAKEKAGINKRVNLWSYSGLSKDDLIKLL